MKFPEQKTIRGSTYKVHMVTGFFYNILAESERSSVFISEFKLIVSCFFFYFLSSKVKNVIGKTRKYSSRMHTARLLTGKGCCREGGGAVLWVRLSRWYCLGVVLSRGAIQVGAIQGWVVFWWMGGVQGGGCWCSRGRGGVGGVQGWGCCP